jgi:hypothetical protein
LALLLRHVVAEAASAEAISLLGRQQEAYAPDSEGDRYALTLSGSQSLAMTYFLSGLSSYVLALVSSHRKTGLQI